MPRHRYTNVVGFDDAPFSAEFQAPVDVVGAVFAGNRFEGLLRGRITRDGDDAAWVLASLVSSSRFSEHVQLILLQGITMGGFNVVDVFELHRSSGKPVLIVARNAPDMASFKEALLTKITGGEEKWRIVEELGPVEPMNSVFVQRVGIDSRDAAAVLEKLTLHGKIPEPLRTAHIIAGGLAIPSSRSRV